MCIYIHPCLFLRKQREVTGVVHIGVGFLRCSFSVVGIAKALNMERTKVRFPRFFIYSFHLTFIRLPGGSQGDTHRKIGHDSCGTAYRTYASRTGTHRHLVRYPTRLHTPQCLQDIPEREYRHPPALAHLLHPQPRLLPRFIRQHQYGQLLRCIQIGYNSVSSLELCFRLLV